MGPIEQIKNKFGRTIEVFEKSTNRVFISVAKGEAAEVVRYLFREMGARFSIASGVDTRAGIEILYHMSFDRHNIVVTVKAMVEKPALEMQSFTGFMPAADWIEREIHEMFGVKFIGHPKLDPLLLPEDWPEGVYPLRKNSFDSEKENMEREN